MKLNGFDLFYPKMNSCTEFDKYACMGDCSYIVINLANIEYCQFTNEPVKAFVLLFTNDCGRKNFLWGHLAPAIERLGIIAYEQNFDNPPVEGLNTEADDEMEYMRMNRSRENFTYREGRCLEAD
jgi:hypothetical protein